MEKTLNLFWNKIENNFTENNHMFILLKIKYLNGQTLTIGNLQRLNLNNKKWDIDFLIEIIKLKSEYYNETQIESLILSYGFKEGKIKDKQESTFSGYIKIIIIIRFQILLIQWIMVK